MFCLAPNGKRRTESHIIKRKDEICPFSILAFLQHTTVDKEPKNRKSHPNGQLFHYLESPVKKSTIACQICAKIFLLFSTALLALKFRLIPEKVLPAFETIESLSELKADLKLALSMIEDLDKFIAKFTRRLICVSERSKL